MPSNIFRDCSRKYASLIKRELLSGHSFEIPAVVSGGDYWFSLLVIFQFLGARWHGSFPASRSMRKLTLTFYSSNLIKTIWISSRFFSKRILQIQTVSNSIYYTTSHQSLDTMTDDVHAMKCNEPACLWRRCRGIRWPTRDLSSSSIRSPTLGSTIFLMNWCTVGLKWSRSKQMSEQNQTSQKLSNQFRKKWHEIVAMATDTASTAVNHSESIWTFVQTNSATTSNNHQPHVWTPISHNDLSIPFLDQAQYCTKHRSVSCARSNFCRSSFKVSLFSARTAPGNDAWEASWGIVSWYHANRVDRDADDADNDHEDDGEAEGHTMNHVHSIKLT